MNVRPETIKLLEESTSHKFLEFILAMIFFKFDTRNKGNEVENKEVGLHQSKMSTQQREPSAKLKGNLLNGRKYLQNIQDQGLIFKIYKEPNQLNEKKRF